MDTIEAFAREHAAQALALLETLAPIPAPPGGEGRRAAFCLNWLRQNGAPQAYRDGAGSVLCPFGPRDGALTVILAHMDVVFPDTEPLPLRREGGRIFCPGVGDDTANLVNLLLLGKYLAAHPPAQGVLLAADVGEEGLGNLRGSRAIFAAFGPRVRACLAFDLFRVGQLVTRAVGSHRFRLTVTGPGGHSWQDFGRPNPIAQLAGLIAALDAQPLPRESRTSVNFGVIEGGESVNAIPRSASVLYEYRSADECCLRVMRAQLEDRLAAARRAGADVSCETLGERPAMGTVDAAAMERMTARAAAAVRAVTSAEPEFLEGSTDANIPLSLGIPALTAATVTGGGAHTRDEWIDTASLSPGLLLALRLAEPYLTKE